MRIAKAPDDLLIDSEGEITEIEALLGARSEGFHVMARKPAMAKAVGELAASIYDDGPIGHDLKVMISYVASRATGSRTGMAQATRRGILHGIPKEKLRALANFEESPKFSNAEKAALRIAHGAGSSPNRVTDDDFDAARAYFDDDQLVDIVGVVAMAAFLNRWNDTIATHPDQDPATVVQIQKNQIKTVETLARRKARLSQDRRRAEPLELSEKVEEDALAARAFRTQKDVRAQLSRPAKSSEDDDQEEPSKKPAAAKPARGKQRRPTSFRRYKWL